MRAALAAVASVLACGACLWLANCPVMYYALPDDRLYNRPLACHLKHRMSPFNPYLLITPAVMLYLGIALLVAWGYDRSQRALWWMSMGVFSTGIPLGIQSVLSSAQIGHYAIYTAVFYLLGAWCIGCSISVKFKAPYAHRIAIVVGAAVMVGLYYYSRVEENLPVRAFILSLGLGILQLLPVLPALRYRPRNDILDAILYWSYVVFCIYTAWRPFMFTVFEQFLVKDLVGSVYWFVTLLSSILFCMTFSFLLLGSCIRNMLRTLHTERNLDPLTNLLNRRAFDESVMHMTAQPGHGEIAVVLADIDHFKRINDQWGHDVGDEVLRQLGHCLRQATRSNDLVARLGGEEFVLVLPRTDIATAYKLAERIQAVLAQGQCELPDLRRVTMSFGVASLREGAVAQGIKQADIALYQAKQSGRDRICIFDAASSSQAGAAPLTERF